MERSAWVTVCVAVGIAALVVGLAGGAAVGRNAFPVVSVSLVPSASPSPVIERVEVAVPVPVPVPTKTITPEVCKRAIDLANQYHEALRELDLKYSQTGFYDTVQADAAGRLVDDYDVAAQRCSNS